LGPSPFGLVTIFYCLRFETSLFVASYDSQGHGGGIRPRLLDSCYIARTQTMLKTQFYCCVVQTTQKTRHVTAISPVLCHVDGCLATSLEFLE
jgi:hypothetical protein